MARRTFGIRPTTAAKQLQKAWPPKAPTQPLPAPTGQPPFRVTPADVGVKEKDPLSIFVIGDHGGIKDPTFQNHVTVAMEAEKPPAFIYSVGDITYFNGDAKEYGPQFFEAYSHFPVPFLSIPGNHDGDVTDVPGRAPLDTWMANFCDTKPRLPPGNEEYGRMTQTQPNCFWTLAGEKITMVGLYSNVPSGGHLEQSQVDWLTGELKDAPSDRPLVVLLHHPPVSIDAHHGGSKKMGDALDLAFDASGRTPDLVLSGHVHDAQFFTRTYKGKQIPYVVIGNSGYHNLHKLSPGATPGQVVDAAHPDIVFEYGDDADWGYLKLTVAGTRLSCEYVGVSHDGLVTPKKHGFVVENGKVS